VRDRSNRQVAPGAPEGKTQKMPFRTRWLGLSRMYDDDLEQLNAGLLLYDAFFRWCRDATRETHNWPTNRVKP
jgi:hypothetical protein